MTTQIATITVSNARPSTIDNFGGGEDYDVTVTVAGRTVVGEISLAPDPGNGGRMTAHGGTIDGWCSGALVDWMRTLDRDSVRAVASSLQGGIGVEDIEVTPDVE